MDLLDRPSISYVYNVLIEQYGKMRSSLHTAVSPNSFIMTAMRYPCRSVKIRLYKQYQPGKLVVKLETDLSKVDFPAPRNPQMIVKGTREG